MTGRGDDSYSRRDLLRLVGATAAAAALSPSRSTFAAEPKDPYAGLKMGMQSYSLRGYNLRDALAHTKMLGLKYWESFPSHIPLSTLPKSIADSKAALRDAGITLMAYGVVD